MSSTPVLVVGAGPVGLSAALLLARHDIACTVVERRATRDRHPKARGVRIRTMELFRQWGLEPRLRTDALPPEARRFIYCDSLAGTEIGRSPAIDEEEDRYSPTTSCRVAQDSVERALLEHVAADPLIRLCTGAELTTLTQCEEGVDSVLLQPDGAQEIVRSEFVIAADGVASTTRRLLGIQLNGPAVLAYWQSIYWHGDISQWAAHRPCIQFMTGAKAGDVATVASVDGRNRWVTMVTRKPSAVAPPPLTTAEARDILTRAVGSDLPDAEIVDIATWRLSAQVAETWQDGRVFLAGDAAHSFPPTGGFGMNTGVQDVHNLVWKLASVLQRTASPNLLSTYTAERKPVAQANADWSVANSGRFRDIAAAIAADDHARLDGLLLDQKEHVHALSQDLGFRYRSTAVLGKHNDDKNDDDKPPKKQFVPDAEPGRRAPHVWITRGGVTLSTLDLFDRDFVLLTGPAGAAWAHAARGLPSSLPRVLAYQAQVDFQATGDFEQAYELGATGAVLVRPDGHVAWRTGAAPVDRRRDDGSDSDVGGHLVAVMEKLVR